MCIGLPKERAGENTAPTIDCMANGELISDMLPRAFGTSKLPAPLTAGECNWAQKLAAGGVLPSRPNGDIIM